VGTGVGVADGPSDGCGVGVWVGAWVGAAVGDSVVVEDEATVATSANQMKRSADLMILDLSYLREPPHGAVRL
jgi:hypothetical protein